MIYTDDNQFIIERYLFSWRVEMLTKTLMMMRMFSLCSIDEIRIDIYFQLKGSRSYFKWCVALDLWHKIAMLKLSLTISCTAAFLGTTRQRPTISPSASSSIRISSLYKQWKCSPELSHKLVHVLSFSLCLSLPYLIYANYLIFCAFARLHICRSILLLDVKLHTLFSCAYPSFLLCFSVHRTMH